MSDETKKEIWKLITKTVPEKIILTVLVYCAVVFGGGQIYTKLTENEKLGVEYIQKVTNIFGILFVVTTVVFVAICLYIFVSKRNKSSIKDGETLPEGKIDAFIVEQDARARDNKFSKINDKVQKSYWVLGVSLTSMVDREATLKKMAKNNVHIKLCMMDPDIAVDNLCLSSMNNETCNLAHLADKIRNGQVNKNDIKSEFNNMNNCHDMLEIYHVLINVLHFNDYYMTDTDYKSRIKDSYKNLKRIKETITNKFGPEAFELKVADSFMPMSLTIADAEEPGGKMVVEFHLPFTQYKVLFEISKQDNDELFKVFVDFYNIVWERANANE